MAIQPIQNTLNTTSKQTSFKRQEKEVKPYLAANEKVTTENNVKPLPAQGHLIHDSFGNGIKYFFKDIAYDVKAVKDGFTGEANDHQLGRLNDVGLKLGGIGIATYLASRTSDPKTRLMEYVGLGTFLAAMSIYPKIAINKPGELIHGFEIDKEYIDDQGRKKSVFQDSNYIPFDMYRGEVKGEDLDEIGDKMGIPRDIHNRHDIIKEQMRKIATQNNTLWMLTAGLATPAMTALICNGLEYPAGYIVEKTKNASVNNKITKLLEQTSKMSEGVNGVKASKTATRVEKILSGYVGQEIPAKEVDNLVKIITENLDNTLATGIKKDITQILKTAKAGEEAFVINNNTVEEMLNGIKSALKGRNLEQTGEILVPTKEELENVIRRTFGSEYGKEELIISKNEMTELKQSLNELLTGKINASGSTGAKLDFLKDQKANVLNSLSISAKPHSSLHVTEESFKEIVNFSKVMGEFKDNWTALDGCKKFKVEAIQDSVLARYFNKFERTLLNELGFTQKELKMMKESEEFTKQILDKKLAELCKDEAKYEKTITKLGKVMSEMEITLHGGNEAKSSMKDLVSAMENNYNKTAKRLESLGGRFAETHNRLVKEEVVDIANSVKSRTDMFDLLDGVRLKDAAKDYSKGIGSSKNNEIARVVDRYAGVKNTFNRIIHSMDFYKRSLNPSKISNKERLAQEIIKDGKEALLTATSSDFTMKLHKTNNPVYFNKLMNTVWQDAGGVVETKHNAVIEESTRKALDKFNSIAKGNLADRNSYAVNRFRNIIANNDNDFASPKHKPNPAVLKAYEPAAQTNNSFFNLVGKTPVDMVKEGAGKKYITNRWLRIMGGFTAGVFGIALLAQAGFGKIRNPHNIKKQVENETK